jgi:hypothetical protein
MSEITVHLNGLARDLIPVPAPVERSWWREDRKTRGHAIHCLPLTMANSLGYLIRSPDAFRVTWNGDWEEDVHVEPLGSVIVDSHSAVATFTVQPGFLVSTREAGDMILIKSLANVRGAWFTAMEALIEAWWQPGIFGLVCMMNRPGSFVVERGQPLAQMAVYKAAGGLARLAVSEELPEETPAWLERRYRPGYRKDLDYLRGLHPNGKAEPTHLRRWRRSRGGVL